MRITNVKSLSATPVAERAPRVPVAASSERGSASRSASAHRGLPEFARLSRFQSAAGHRPALRSGARASARFTVRTLVAFKTNSNVTNIRTLKRRERRAPLTPEASNMNSRGCQPTVIHAIATRPRRGRTIHRATICSTLAGSGIISGTCSVGLHPRLFTLHPFGIHLDRAGRAQRRRRFRTHEGRTNLRKPLPARKAGSRFACPRTPRPHPARTRFTHLTP